jgi:hypothetical protein
MRKVVVFLIVAALVVPWPVPRDAFAGGSGGEPLISDAVGWGIVAALVVVGLYVVYKSNAVNPPEEGKEKEKTSYIEMLKNESVKYSDHRGLLLIASW